MARISFLFFIFLASFEFPGHLLGDAKSERAIGIGGGAILELVFGGLDGVRDFSSGFLREKIDSDGECGGFPSRKVFDGILHFIFSEVDAANDGFGGFGVLKKVGRGLVDEEFDFAARAKDVGFCDNGNGSGDGARGFFHYAIGSKICVLDVVKFPFLELFANVWQGIEVDEFRAMILPAAGFLEVGDYDEVFSWFSSDSKVNFSKIDGFGGPALHGCAQDFQGAEVGRLEGEVKDGVRKLSSLA